MKQCSKCGGIKPLSGFFRRARVKSGFMAACKLCTTAYNEAYRLANPVKHAARVASWRGKNPGRATEIDRAWVLNNPEKARAKSRKYTAKNPGRSTASTRAYYKANPHKATAKVARYEAQKLKATSAWRNDFFIEEAYHLAGLRTKCTGFKWEVDHIVPLNSNIVCGLHTEQNMQVIPARVNNSKGNRHWPDMPVALGA